jgi:hypothetical protein
VEHPIYDIWLTDCKNPDTAVVSADAPKPVSPPPPAAQKRAAPKQQAARPPLQQQLNPPPAIRQ